MHHELEQIMRKVSHLGATAMRNIADRQQQLQELLSEKNGYVCSAYAEKAYAKMAPAYMKAGQSLADAKIIAYMRGMTAAASAIHKTYADCITDIALAISAMTTLILEAEEIASRPD